MNLFDRINEDLKDAMRAKDQGRLRAVRAIKAALLLMKTETADKEISEADEIKLLQRLVKQRKDSIEVFQKQDRDDLVAEEKEELIFIETYLPQQLSLDEVRSILTEIINEVGAQSMSDMGKVMPVAMQRLAGKSDGKTISEVIKSILA